MSQDRVIFIPWNEAQAGIFKSEYENNQAERKNTHHKRKWTIVYLDSPGKPLASVGFGFGTRIHISAHGDVGDPKIYADHGTGGQDLTCSDLVDRLIDQGLKKYYIGTIACDICYSALGAPPFSKLLARELWSRGIKASCVLGYKGGLYVQYRDRGGKYYQRKLEFDDGSTGKSKDAQERFFGWT